MSLSKSVDITSKYLVYGYIRVIKIKNKIIPLSIIQLCIKFYESNNKKLSGNLEIQIIKN